MFRIRHDSVEKSLKKEPHKKLKYEPKMNAIP